MQTMTRLLAATLPMMPTAALAGKSPRKLTKEELTQLLPGAKMGRLSRNGNRHLWTNDSDGTFVISLDNQGVNSVAGTRNRGSTARDKWQTSDGYYGVRSDSVGTELVHKLEINK